MEQLLQDVADVERLGSEFESTYYKVDLTAQNSHSVCSAVTDMLYCRLHNAAQTFRV